MANLLWWALCNSEGWLSFFFFLFSIFAGTKDIVKAWKWQTERLHPNRNQDKHRKWQEAQPGRWKEAGKFRWEPGCQLLPVYGCVSWSSWPPRFSCGREVGKPLACCGQWTKGSLNWLIWFACRVTAYMLYSNTASWSAQPGFSSSFLPLCTTLHLSFPFNVVIKPHFDVILWNVFPIPKPGFREGLFQL